MSHFTTVWLKENQVRLVGSYRSFTCIYKVQPGRTTQTTSEQTFLKLIVSAHAPEQESLAVWFRPDLLFGSDPQLPGTSNMAHSALPLLGM